ncbi:MAG: tyrosine-type recombinase/integrase [Actinomycetota bacterium]|nr:tyrosine-type recombinase/integrase [Actinomycetota bacterium]
MPQILEPAEVSALLGALRRWRDRAMVEAMLLGGLRRSEVLGLRLEDLRPGERRVFVADGKGGHQRLVPMSSRLFASVAAYLDTERPASADTDARARGLLSFTTHESAPGGVDASLRPIRSALAVSLKLESEVRTVRDPDVVWRPLDDPAIDVVISAA